LEEREIGKEETHANKNRSLVVLLFSRGFVWVKVNRMEAEKQNKATLARVKCVSHQICETINVCSARRSHTLVDSWNLMRK
jgi:hypothetical protein